MSVDGMLGRKEKTAGGGRDGGKKGEADMRGGWRKSRRKRRDTWQEGGGREQGKVTWTSD